VKAYWTKTGGEPEQGIDVVGGNILVEVATNATIFTITYGGEAHMDSYPLRGTAAGSSGTVSTPQAPVVAPKYAWSKKSSHCHLADCRFVQNIAPTNLVQGDTPPKNKTLHKDSPQ
jgi:hypothetical protein